MAQKKLVMNTVALVLDKRDYTDLKDILFWASNNFKDERRKNAGRLARLLDWTLQTEGGFK